LLRKNRKRGIICHFAVLDDPAVAMIRVFTEAHIGNHKKLYVRFANRFDRALNHPLRAQ